VDITAALVGIAIGGKQVGALSVTYNGRNGSYGGESSSQVWKRERLYGKRESYGRNENCVPSDTNLRDQSIEMTR